MGRYDLDLTEGEFWSLTLNEFNALITRWNRKEDWLNYRAGLICSTLSNIWRAKGAKPRTPEDFFPTRQRRYQTPEQILSAVKLMNSAFGGVVVLED